MKVFITILFLALLPLAAFAADGDELVKVYCFSDDLEAGFKDIPASAFCAELQKRGNKKSSLECVESRNIAHATVHFVGAETLRKRGEAIYINYGIAWNPAININRRTAIISVRGFSKEFIGEGVNASASATLIKKLEEWIRENKDTILKKAKDK